MTAGEDSNRRGATVRRDPRRRRDNMTDPSRRPLIATVLGALDLALGIVLLVEAPARTSNAAFKVARQAPGGMTTWGAILLVLACLIIARTAVDRHAGYALSLAGAWHAFFVVAITASALADSRVALTGICAYTCIVILHLLAAWRKVR